MARRRLPGSRVVMHDHGEWASVRRQSSRAAAEVFPAALLADGVRVHEVVTLRPRSGAAGSVALLDLELSPTRAGEGYALGLIRPSGALTLHGPEPTPVPRSRAGSHSLRFRVPLRAPRRPDPRRGIATTVVTVVVLEVAARVSDALLPRLAADWEAAAWKRAASPAGWLRVDRGSLAAGKLAPCDPRREPPKGRALLLLHGTFSSAERAFRELAGGDFLARVAPLYGDRVFAFNHPSVSRTPEDNAAALVAGLPAKPTPFDVVSHSRGGLVLRELVERRASADAKRFRLGRAVLAACPNQGTPLASPERWRETAGWLANLLQLFPDNPLTFAAAFVAQAIVWIARRAAGGLPGIAAMDAAGSAIAALGELAGPADRYSALVANGAPGPALWQRLLDAGVDGFFAGANDLVVPTEGGWRVGAAGALIPGERVGCFGPGGNLGAPDRDVHHMNMLAQPEASVFVADALLGRLGRAPALDTSRPLPDRRLSRRAERASGPAPERSGSAGGAPAPARPRPDDDDALHLIVLPRSGPERQAQLFAQFRGARVLEPLAVRSGQAGARWREIIRGHQSMLGHLAGSHQRGLPSGPALAAYGTTLFEALFPGDVRRLYDAARASLRPGKRLPVVLTSMIPWIAEKPWELAHDPARGAFLATEEVHLVRDVLTAVPAERNEPSDGLRILVAVAQPIGAGQLSAQEETAVVRRGFEPLVEAGLAQVDTLASATPAAFHERLAGARYDVVHFVGHGEFDERSGRGALLFEDGRGSVQRLDDRALRGLLCGRGIRLVFLNACETGRGGRADFNRGVAPALVAAGLPAVVANQYAVLDASATAFARQLYWCLGRGFGIADATREGRLAVGYAHAGESIDFAIPVLYARDPDAALCRPPGRPLPRAAPAVSRRERRATRRHAHHVGVWDVADGFPWLETTLAELNERQRRFGFERVDASAPLGSWRIARRGATGGAPEIEPELIAQRLSGLPEALGLDAVVCLTRQPLAGDATAGMWAWWPDAPGARLGLATAAGLELPPRGPATDSWLANALALCAAALVSRLKLHPGGGRTCPLRESASPELMTGRQELDALCRRRFGPHARADLAGFDALLAAFHRG